MVDDAARLHDQPASAPVSTAATSSHRQQLHARRPAAGAELDPHGPGRQSRHRRPGSPRSASFSSRSPRTRARSRGGSASYQTASPLKLGDTPGQSNFPGWQTAVADRRQRRMPAISSSGTIRQNNGFLGFSPRPGAAVWPRSSPAAPPRRQAAPDDGSALGFLAPAYRDGQPRDGRLLGHRCGAAGERHAAGRLQRHADVPERRHARRLQLRRHRVGPGQRLDPVVRGLARPGEHGAGEPHATRSPPAPTWCRSRRRTAAGTPRFAPSASRSRQPRLHPAGAARAAGPAAFQGNGMLVVGGVQSRASRCRQSPDRRRAATPRCSRRWRPAPTARQASRSAAPSRCWPAARRASPGRSAPRGPGRRRAAGRTAGR